MQSKQVYCSVSVFKLFRSLLARSGDKPSIREAHISEMLFKVCV